MNQIEIADLAEMMPVLLHIENQDDDWLKNMNLLLKLFNESDDVNINVEHLDSRNPIIITALEHDLDLSILETDELLKVNTMIVEALYEQVIAGIELNPEFKNNTRPQISTFIACYQWLIDSMVDMYADKYANLTGKKAKRLEPWNNF